MSLSKWKMMKKKTNSQVSVHFFFNLQLQFSYFSFKTSCEFFYETFLSSISTSLYFFQASAVKGSRLYQVFLCCTSSLSWKFLFHCSENINSFRFPTPTFRRLLHLRFSLKTLKKKCKGKVKFSVFFGKENSQILHVSTNRRTEHHAIKKFWEFENWEFCNNKWILYIISNFKIVVKIRSTSTRTFLDFFILFSNHKSLCDKVGILK